MSEVKSFLVRLPVGLHSRIAGVAEEERRSMHSVVLLALEECFGVGASGSQEAPRSSPKSKGGGEAPKKVVESSRPVAGYTTPREWTGVIPKSGKGKK